MYVEGRAAHGCSHYRRHCEVLSPCCQMFVSCRRCHDEDEDRACTHDLNRRAISRLRCCACGLEQLVGEACLRCGQRFGNYFCPICRFFDDDTHKQQYHCRGCGICRVGGRHNFKHCPRCCVCYSRERFASHVCVEQAADRNCPVCLEHLHSSTRKLFAPPCGHFLHEHCYRLLVSTTSKCPICTQSYLDLSSKYKHLDAQIQQTPMPPQYNNTFVHISCRDCSRKSYAKFHTLGHKCRFCMSYDTMQLGEPMEGPPPDDDAQEDEGTASRWNSEDRTADSSAHSSVAQQLEEARERVRRLELQRGLTGSSAATDPLALSDAEEDHDSAAHTGIEEDDPSLRDPEHQQ